MSNDKTLKSKQKKFLLGMIGIFVFLGVWQLAGTLGLVSTKILASPTKVIATFFDKFTNPKPDGATLLEHLWVSLRLALIGFGAACVIGIPLGLTMGFFKGMDYFFNPIFEIIRPIPPLAWIPVILLILGIGTSAKAFIIFVAAFVPCLLNSYVGIKRTRTTLINVARTSGASNAQIFFKVGIPSAIPMIFTGVKVSLGTSWATLVAAELLSSSVGLGYMIQRGRTLVRSDIIIVGMLTIGVVGAFLAFLLSLLEKKIAPWRNKK